MTQFLIFHLALTALLTGANASSPPSATGAVLRRSDKLSPSPAVTGSLASSSIGASVQQNKSIAENNASVIGNSSLAGNMSSSMNISALGNSSTNGSSPLMFKFGGGQPQSVVKLNTTRSGFTKVTAAPAGATAQANHTYVLPTESIAAACYTTIQPFQTSVWMHTNEVKVIGGPWFNNSIQSTYTNWTISTDTPGVVLGPLSTSADTLFEMKRNGSHSMSFVPGIPYGWDTTDVTFSVYNDNGSTIDTATWNRDGNTKLDPKSAVNGLGFENVFFRLNITGGIKCDNPVQLRNCSQISPNMTAKNWRDYRVDEFISRWNASKKGDFGSIGFFETFKSDFGISTNQCNVQKQCDLMQSCGQQAHPDGPDAIPVFLAHQAMANLANFFNTIYGNVLSSSSFEGNNVPTMVMNFWDPKPATPSQTASKSEVSDKTKASEGLGMGSMILGLLAVGASALIPVAGPALAGGLAIGLGAASAAGGIASSGIGIDQTRNSAGGQAGQQIVIDNKAFENSASLSSTVNQIITSLQYNIAVWQTTVLSQGNGLAGILRNGSLVDPHTSQFSTMDSERASAWLQRYLSIKLINRAWWLQNVFVAYVPYADNLPYDGKKLTKENCKSDFLGKAHDGEMILCDVDDIWKDVKDTFNGPGMLRLSMYDPSKVQGVPCGKSGNGTIKIDRTPYGANKNPSFNSAGGEFKFNAQDLLRGSMRSWLKGGWNYDYSQDLFQNQETGVSANAALMSMAGLANITQTSAGMYNIPVIRLSSMGDWPTRYSGSDYRGVKGNMYWDGSNNISILDEGVLAPQFRQFINQTDFPGKVAQNGC